MGFCAWCNYLPAPVPSEPCAADFGTNEVNRFIAPFQAAVLRELGLEFMIPL